MRHLRNRRSRNSGPGAEPQGSAPRSPGPVSPTLKTGPTPPASSPGDRAGARRTNLIGLILVLAAAGALTSCETARHFAPPPPLRAASAASFAVDVEFDVPLDAATAQDPTRYSIVPAAGGSGAVITNATLIDTLNGRTVQLLIPDWLATDPDTTDFDLTTTGVVSVYGKSTGTRTVRFRTGLSYSAPMRDWFDSRCTSCHGATRADGAYRTDSYAEILGPGTNSFANVIPGDLQCLTVTKCKPKNSMFDLARLSYLDYEIVKNWVGSYAARP